VQGDKYAFYWLPYKIVARIYWICKNQPGLVDYTYSNPVAFAESHHNSRANIGAFYLHTLLKADYSEVK